MIVAIAAVHLQNGLFMLNNGYEFGLALLVISVGLALRSAGGISADRLLHAQMVKQQRRLNISSHGGIA